MTKVLVTEVHLQDIADAIRSKNGEFTTYRPGEMAAAIADIETGYPEPTGTLAVTANGTVNVKDYASANVNVQPNLQSKTATENGTVTADSGYDGLSQVAVNVSGGGGGGVDVPQGTKDFAAYINQNVILEMDPSTSEITIGDIEYSGYIYGETAMIDSLGLVLLGDFSQGGAATGNALSDSIENYTGVILQGVYTKQRTSRYNTSMYYTLPELDTAYWAGMKDRNASYDCNVTFTDGTHCDLTGNRQVIIYGVP